MIAIRITQSNLDTILQHSDIRREEMQRMIDEYDTLVRETALYFVPQHELAHTMNSGSWMSVPRKALDEMFKFDDSKIDTQFVEITRK